MRQPAPTLSCFSARVSMHRSQAFPAACPVVKFLNIHQKTPELVRQTGQSASRTGALDKVLPVLLFACVLAADPTAAQQQHNNGLHFALRAAPTGARGQARTGGGPAVTPRTPRVCSTWKSCCRICCRCMRRRRLRGDKAFAAQRVFRLRIRTRPHRYNTALRILARRGQNRPNRTVRRRENGGAGAHIV